MKVKSKIIFSIICITLMLAMLMQNVSFATTVTDPSEMLYIGITELRNNDTPNLGYAIGDPITSTGATIWNLREFTGSSSTADLKSNGSKDIYCLKAGLGFRNTNDRATYDVFYDMKTERGDIEAHNSVLAEIVNGTVGTVNRYDAILALGDMLYLVSDDNNDRLEYLERAGIRAEEHDQLLTRDEIVSVQQAALWYFTNSEDPEFDKTENTGWLYYTTNGTSYESLFNYTDRERSEESEILYNYLIRTAKSRASQYAGVTSNEAPATLTTTSLNYEPSGSNYIIGPINFAKNEKNPIDYEIEFLVNNKTTGYQLLKSDKQPVSAGTTVKDLVGQNFYISVPNTTKEVEIETKIKYEDTTLTLWTATAYDNGAKTQPVLIPKKEKHNPSATLRVTPTPAQKKFDLSLRKYITKVGDVELTGAKSRVPQINTDPLKSGTNKTTAEYKHRKDPVPVTTGLKVIYNIEIYNESETAGRATKIVDQLPTGLKFNRVVSGNFEQDSYVPATNRLTLKRKSGNNTNLNPYEEGKKLSSEIIQIECIVEAEEAEKKQVLTNLAWISEEINGETGDTITTQVGLDRDSEPGTITILNKDELVTTDNGYTGNASNSGKALDNPNNYFEGQQDDDDFEKIVIPSKVKADLKLVKRIVEVNGTKVPERIKSVDVSNLNKKDVEGKIIATTADYELDKDPIEVKKGDIVTYTFRIYNEGMIDAYASEITEDIPEGLKYFGDPNEENLADAEKEVAQFNKDNGWGEEVENADGTRTVSTNNLSIDNEGKKGENLIKAFGENDGTKTEADLKYKEVSIKFKVVSNNITGTVIRNEAAITEDTDENGDDVDDRDSKTDEWKKYEDDEDYDNIILKQFDLALRKFIIAVSKDETIEESEYLKTENGALFKRAPEVETSKLNTVGEDGKLITTATYNHTKEPVLVQKNDIVVYMLRVYNEGDIDGYASEIKDHLPPYLEFVEGEFNDEYGWEASEDGKTVTTEYLSSEDKIIGKAEKDSNDEYVLKYQEVPIMCKVIDTAPTNQNITNIADITKYADDKKNPVEEDRDSEIDNVKLPKDDELPGYMDDKTGEYIPGQQDDDDFEKVIVKRFDLALRKWVTQAIVTDNTGTKVTNTGHQPYDDPEEIVKVELDKKKLNQITVKFRYSIRVINEGDIEGYAKEVTDYIPEGLKFVATDNPGWTDEGNNVISTKLLENTLLKPGEFADVEVLLTWENNPNNMSLKVNTAEISEDYNEYNVPDDDSTPDNKKKGEDDIDDAPVMLSIKTGQMRIYFTLGFTVLLTVAGGIVLIKKYVL